MSNGHEPEMRAAMVFCMAASVAICSLALWMMSQ